MSALKWIHLERVQHCTDLPLKITFPAHTELGKMRPGKKMVNMRGMPGVAGTFGEAKKSFRPQAASGTAPPR